MSTLSQLGMMLFILFVGLWKLSFIHLLIHAFFKSILFLGAGSLISQLFGSQESRFYGGLVGGYSSFLYFLVRVFCLCGFPFFLGFYSKDSIIFGSSIDSGFLLYCVFFLSCLFTVFYRYRLVVQGYFSFIKGYVLGAFSDDYYFSFPVFFLFFKGWLLGGGSCWLFFLWSFVFFFLFLTY